jgi:hypothetical protein
MCALDGLADRMSDEPIAYDLAQPYVARVSIHKQQPTLEMPKGGPVLASCTTSLELDDSEGLCDLTSAIAKSKDGVWANFGDLNDGENAIHKAGDPAFNRRVTATHNIVDPVFAQLGAQLKKSIAILKWRYGLIDAPFNSFSNWSEAVSLDGSAWRGISTLRGFRIQFLHPARKIGPPALDETGRLHNEGEEPPLGLQLLVEAWNQRTTHPRSALVIGVTAAEIALKQLVGELAPDAQWLIDNVPSPPILKIAKDYIPTLRVKARLTGKTLRPPKPLLKKLNEAVELRNKVVHAGKAPPEPDELKEILVSMEDLVWICDLYKGHTWAWDHISYETKTAWEDEK